MKKIEAYIQERKLDAVILALHQQPAVTGASVVPVRGFGRPRADDGPSELKPVIQLVLYVADDAVDAIVACIKNAAHTGLRGDGKIYVLPVDTCVRIAAATDDIQKR